uniref:Uncharacterized protein n=1 Tax=Trypanosoma congolense (strain IL3000) TaxID=1068625 RepID=G0UZP8_TRYCI|nr:hypothetical protein, unlikely [Trypanosoma congolense IL3000]
MTTGKGGEVKKEKHKNMGMNWPLTCSKVQQGNHDELVTMESVRKKKDARVKRRTLKSTTTTTTRRGENLFIYDYPLPAEDKQKTRMKRKKHSEVGAKRKKRKLVKKNRGKTRETKKMLVWGGSHNLVHGSYQGISN